MTHTTVTSPASATTTTTSSGLRSLHLIRVAFSLVWVTLVLTTSGSLVSTDRPTVIAGLLLVTYPLWDVIATLLERRLAGPGSTHRVTAVNMALGLATTAGMIVAVFSDVRAALLVFGVWALLSGAVQLTVAIRRRRTVGAQWPMIVSGAQSVLAGVTIAVGSASAGSGLSALAGYSAFGAFWFLVSAVALSNRGRREAR
ncbi:MULTISPECIES: DUF308 domain-containing protein [Streptomyces]|uniref:DUF308 domain-containing protein n=1 Tax=Streptomyces pseudovenezuelae TaxID=67350 RepID=A0A117PMK0_9ACTN|nr:MULTISPECIES: DUF308 domain-containing protein [Streptomyces]KUM82403.1 hypothetical protein AQI94_41460 [Streptomyces pseudovenezuelae]